MDRKSTWAAIRPSVSNTILLNTAIALAVSLIFAISTMFFYNAVKKERLAASDRIFENFIEKYMTETNQLRDTMCLCKDDPAFIMAANHQLEDYTLLMDYVNRAGSGLSILKSTIASAKRVLLYVKNGQRFITDEKRITDKEVFAETFALDLADGEVVPDFDSLEDGWTSFENFALYVTNIFNYGSIILQADAGKLVDIREISVVNQGLYIIVLDRNGYYFTSSIIGNSSILTRLDYSDYVDGGQRTLPGNDNILCNVKRISEGEFSFLLLTDISTIEKSYARFNQIAIVVICAVVLILIGMLLINAAPSRLLRRVLRKYGYKEREKEIQFVDDMFQQYESRQQAISAEIDLWRNMQLNVSMNYLIETDKELPQKALSFLAENYSRYFVLYLAGQDENGKLDKMVFMGLDEYLADYYSCSGVSPNSFERIYIIEEDDYNLNLVDILSQYFMSFKEPLRFYVGFSDVYTDISRLRDAVSQAHTNLGKAPIEDTVLSIAGDKKADGPAYSGISVGTQRAIVEAALNHQSEKLKKTLRLVLFETPGMCFRDLECVFHILVDQLQIVVNSIGMNPEGILSRMQRIRQFYHPVYFYRTILSDYMMVEEHLNQTSNKNHDFGSEMLSYLNNHYCEELTLDSVAEQFHITPVYFSRSFKAKNGINFSAYLSNLRIEKAKELMRKNPDLKNQEIGIQVGIPNVLTFIRHFKNNTGQTPEQFKKECIRKGYAHR